MLTLVATPAAADANTYATVAEADSYHEGHVQGSIWTLLSSGEKAIRLVMAARLLDAMPGAWTGVAASETQAMGWPRTGMLNRNGFVIASGEVPANLKWAQSEFARQLSLEDTTETNSILAQGITSIKAGSVALTFKDPLSQEDAAIPSSRALAPMVPDAVRILLVPSWLIDPREEDALAGYSDLMVEVL